MRKKYDFLKNMNRCILSFAEATKKASMKLYYNFVGIIKKVLSFFKKASMAIFIGLAITLHLIPIISSFYTGNSVEWLPVVGMVVALIMVAILYYHASIVKLFNMAGNTAAYTEYFSCTTMILALGYYVCTSIADGFFRTETDFLSKIFYVVICILSLFFVCKYCAEIKDLIDKEYKYSKKAFLFLWILIQMAQFFALSYTALICLNKFSFEFPQGLELTTSSELAFEMLYFSAMTLLTVGGELAARSVLAKLLVFFESAIFAVFISMIVFSGVFPKNETNKTNQTSLEQEDTTTSVDTKIKP